MLRNFMGISPRRSAKMPNSRPPLPGDDEIDPSLFFGDTKRRRKTNYRGLQLSRQVSEALSYVLSGGNASEELCCLHVVSVVPAPDSSRLLVVLWPDVDEATFDRAAVTARLAEQQGRIRSEVAAAITRKKAPWLIFEILDPRATPGEYA
jgi:ribosome-binding factor A